MGDRLAETEAGTVASASTESCRRKIEVPVEKPPDPERAMAITEDQRPRSVPRGECAAAPPADLLDPTAASPWERYEDLGCIGRGGMGEVRRVRDRQLGRLLAMKLLAADAMDHPTSQARFLAEARLTARLQHPGIVPVHDCGALEDGRLWFTMKEVRGRTLREVVETLHGPGETGPAPSALRSVIDAYLRTCEAVAYAHAEGVVHRDLKPDNVMIGALGEVLVLDWGIARPLAGALDDAVPSSRDSGVAPLTQQGQVLGTPAYMPPEQARGDTGRLAFASDVYALGAILYEILSGTPPYYGKAMAIWAQVLHGPPEPIRTRARSAPPEELAVLCERAMARNPEDRFPDAGALAIEVRSILDGAKRRDRALALVGEALDLGREVATLRERAGSLRTEAQARLSALQTYDAAETKAACWALEDEARAADLAAALKEVDWQQKLRAALDEAPDLPEAHEALADTYAADLRAAELARSPESAARAEALLRQHDRGRHTAVLRGDGSLTLWTDPDGAEVWAFRYIERQRRLVEEPGGLLGRTPLCGVKLSHGSYLLRIRAPGRSEMRYPVLIGRGEHWDGLRPGSAGPWVIPLLPADLAPDDVVVPAGWCLLGGDPAAGESLPLRRLWVDAFIMRRHPVTQAEYLAFLNDLVEAGREAEALSACPRVPMSMAGKADSPLLFARHGDGRFHPGPLTSPDQLRQPVASVSWESAMAYAAWWSARTGEAWRLPGELEREKAARGADGRFLPWGDQLEPTWACMVGSRPGTPGPTSVDAYTTDESPYGIRGLAGNVRDWCVDGWTPEGPPCEEGRLLIVPAALGDPALRAVRGGAWLAPQQLCRAATRFAAGPQEHHASVGLRLARSIEPQHGPATP